MLHRRNTLHKHKYLENGTLSTLLTFTIVFYECVEHLPFKQETAVYTLNRGVAKITFSCSSFFLSFSLTRANSLPHRLHAPLFTSICSAPYRAGLCRGVGAGGGQGGSSCPPPPPPPPHFLTRGAWPPTFLQCTAMAIIHL